jgi:hypothetical protein
MYRSTLTSALVGGVVSVSAALPPGEVAPGTHLIGSWVDARAGLDDTEN